MVYEVLDDNEVFDAVVLGDSVFCSRVYFSVVIRLLRFLLIIDLVF